jgi:prepilin-type N-terminal cleavage/methylation domain-containing protein
MTGEESFMNRPSESTESKGFTLLELLVVLLVFTFIIGGVFNVLGQSQKRYQFEQDVAESQQMARNCIEIMEREIRLAGFPKTSYYDSALGWTASNSNRVARKFVAPSGTTTSPTHMVFEGDIDEDGIVEVVEYRLNSGALERSAVDKPAGGGAWVSAFRAVAQNASAASFNYFDSSGTATTDPTNVSRVQIRLGLTTATVAPESHRSRTIAIETTALVRN